MILALLLIAVAGALTAGWIAVVTARSTMTEQMTAASQRRIALENSKALAQEFMLERVIPSVSGIAFSYNLDDPAWGGISVPAWGSAPLQSIIKAAGVNHFNPGNGDGYTLDLAVTVRDGDANPLRKYQIKSRSPLLAGTLLSSQTPTITPSASIAIDSLAVSGAAFVWKPTLSMTFTANSYSTPDAVTAVSFTNSASSPLAMNNLSLPRQIANPRTGVAPFYTGQLDAIDNTDLAANSSTTKATSGGGVTVNGSTPSSSNGVVCDGSGNVTITLSDPALGDVYIPGEISTLTLTGQATINNAAADDLPAILIVVAQPSGSSRDLTSITLNQHNSRRLDLVVKKAASIGNLPVNLPTASAAWRLLLEIENTPVALTAAGTAIIQGGIRSDRTVALSGGALSLILETDPKNLDRLATRTAWVESFAQ